MTWPDDFLNKVTCCDCRDALRELPDGCVDAVVTDPPYGCGVTYASWDDSFDSWRALITLAVPEMRRVSRGPVLVFSASPMRFQEVMRMLEPERMLVWAPEFSFAKVGANGMFYRYHPVWCWGLGDKSGHWSDVLRHNCDGHNWWNHPGTKPLNLMYALVKFAPEGGTVLDPFLGSGTTAVACIAEGRDFIGIELDPGYCAIAERRIAQARREFQPRLLDAPRSAPVTASLFAEGDDDLAG